MEGLTFDDIIRAIKSDSADKSINKKLPIIIKNNFRHISEDSEEEQEFDEDEFYEKNYEKLLEFFKKLIILKRLDLLEIGLETFLNDNKDYVLLLSDLAPTFWKNKMLKEYYKIFTKYNRNEYSVDESLSEQIADMFLDIDPNEIYYLITETAIFAIENRHYQLMKFIVDTWDSRDDERTINFSIEGMSDDDLKKTLSTIDLLKDILDKRSK